MPELYSYTGTDVSALVKSQFGEEGDVQVTDVHVLRWINNGQREIAIRNKFLKGKYQGDLVADQAQYSFAAERVMLIDSVFVNGLPVSIIPNEEADQWVRRMDPKGTSRSSQPQVGWFYDGDLTFYPAPSSSVTGGLRMQYTKYPADLETIADTLTIPDRLYNQLIDYCLAQAQYLDTNFEAAKQNLTNFEEGLARQSQLENATPTNEYTQIQGDPDDLMYVGDGYGEW